MGNTRNSHQQQTHRSKSVRCMESTAPEFTCPARIPDIAAPSTTELPGPLSQEQPSSAPAHNRMGIGPIGHNLIDGNGPHGTADPPKPHCRLTLAALMDAAALVKELRQRPATADESATN